MSINLIEIVRARFQTDEESDSLNSRFRTRLGLGDRYLPARLAIAKSLAIPEQLPVLSSSQQGKVIKGDVLFGKEPADLGCWLSLFVEHYEQDIQDIKTLQQQVSGHWRRGIQLLDKEWENSGRDRAKFIQQLVAASRLPSDVLDSSISSTGIITASIGTVEWALNGPGGSPHCAIMGGAGSGKTRTAVQILEAIHDHSSVPFLAFDFKGDLGTDEQGGGYHLDKIFHAQTISVPRQPIPLDVLAMRTREDYDIAQAADRFRDSFGRLKSFRLGDLQRNTLHDAASYALAKHIPCELLHIREKLVEIYSDRGATDDSLIATMKDICLFPIFEPTYRAEEFFSKNWIIHFPHDTADNTKYITVNLVLDALDRYINALPDSSLTENGARDLRILCMVDEAQNVLKTKLHALSNLVRRSRSKGGAIMLISQSPDDFSSVEEDFLSEMGLVVAFATNAQSRNASRILGSKANLAGLATGECYVKIRGSSSSEKVIAWSQ